MSSYKPLKPEDIDESLVKLVEFSNQHHVLLPYIDATGAAPEYRSLGHSTTHSTIKIEDLDALSAAMHLREQEASWFILFNTPWLLRKTDVESPRRPVPGRR